MARGHGSRAIRVKHIGFQAHYSIAYNANSHYPKHSHWPLLRQAPGMRLLGHFWQRDGGGCVGTAGGAEVEFWSGKMDGACEEAHNLVGLISRYLCMAVINPSLESGICGFTRAGCATASYVRCAPHTAHKYIHICHCHVSSRLCHPS